MRALLRAILILIVLVIAVVAGSMYLFGSGAGGSRSAADRDTTGTSGTGQVEPARPPGPQKDAPGPFNPAKAREQGAAAGEKLAEAGNQAAAFMSDAALTARIKSKMALDDGVKASSIHIATNAGVVTLTGTVRTEDERRRAVALAKDTEGVKSIVDRMKVGQQ